MNNNISAHFFNMKNSKAHQIEGRIFCYYDDVLYVYDDELELWTEYVEKEATVLVNADRLEKRADMAELEIEELKEENRRLSMRLRRFEVQNARLCDKQEVSQRRYTTLFFSVVAGLTGLALWGNGVIDMIVSSF